MRKKKTSKRKAKSKTQNWPERFKNWLGELHIPGRLVAAGVRTRLLLIMAGLALCAAILWGMHRVVLDRQESAGPVAYRVELAEVPNWMSMELVRELRASLNPKGNADDASLCREVYSLGCKIPWISEIENIRRLRKPDCQQGVISVSATFRQPVAKVQYDNRIYFVHSKGVVLPYDNVPQWAAKIGDDIRYYTSEDSVPFSARPMRIHYVTIQGARSLPPKIGEAWQGEDLQHGLRLVKLISDRHWANQITVVDVRNHKKRISESEPELRLYAQQGQSRPTDILFGRFPLEGDWVVPPATKLKYIDEYVADHNGKLAGINSYIDVRQDGLRISVN